jgi:hypothetical protein
MLGVNGNPAPDYDPRGVRERVMINDENPYQNMEPSTYRPSASYVSSLARPEDVADAFFARASTGPSSSEAVVKRTQKYVPSQFEDPIGYRPKPAVPKISASEKMGLINLRKRIERIIEMYPNDSDYKNIFDSGSEVLITHYQELNTEMANMYPCQALPGSPMYHIAKKNGWQLPDSFEGYAFLSYESQPLPTKYLSSADVLAFRDSAWHEYFTNQRYLNLVEQRAEFFVKLWLKTN